MLGEIMRVSIDVITIWEQHVLESGWKEFFIPTGETNLCYEKWCVNNKFKLKILILMIWIMVMRIEHNSTRF